MTLKPREDEIPLNLGMDTKQSAEMQKPGTMRLVQNLHWRGLGEIEKRPTHGVNHQVAAPSGSAYAVGESCGLVQREQDAVLITGDHGLMTYSEVTGAAQWVRRAGTGTPTATMRFAPVSYDVSRRFVESAGYNTTNQGVYQVASAQHNGIQVLAWTTYDADGTTFILRLKAFEQDTGKLVAANEVTGAGGGTALHACEYTESGKEGVLIAYVSDVLVPGTVKTLRYDAATHEFVGDSDLSTNIKNAYICLVKKGNSILFGFTDNTSGFLTVEERTISTVSSTHTANHAASAGCYALVGASRVLIVSAVAATAYAEVFGAPANVITVHTASSENFQGVSAALETRVGSTHDAVMWVNSVTTAAPTGTRVRAAEIDFATTTPVKGYALHIPHVWLVSHGFTLRGGAHAVFGAFLFSVPYGQPSPASPSSCFVARWRGNDDGNDVRMDAVAKVCHDRFFSLAVADVQSSSYVDGSNNAWIALTADPSEWNVSMLGAALPQTVFLERVSAARPMPMPYAQPDRGVVLVAGGLPWVFDGDTPCEAAALCKPLIKVDVGTSSGGVSDLTGTFTLRAMYRRVDKAGNLYLMPGPDVSTGAITAKTVVAYVSVCPFAALDGYNLGAEDDLEPELYITEDDGSTYYLATDATLARSKLNYDQKTTDGLWFKFTIAHAALDTDPEWPFPEFDASGNPGPIEPEPTPAFRHVAKVVDRMWAVDGEDATRIWPSKPLVAGFGTEWSAGNCIFIQDDCTGVVDMGGGAMVLARGGTYIVTGEGPDATGQGSFAPAVKLNGHVDCIDPASVCRTPLGVIFRGRRGFYVLNGGEVQPFGVPIDPEVLTDPALDPSASTSYRMRVVYQEATSEIHITQTPQAGGIYRFVYNLFEQKWSRYVTSGSFPRDIAVARGKLWQLTRSGGADYLRDELLYAHSGAAYNNDADTQCEIDTPWLEPEGGGLIRIWRIWPRFLLPSDSADITSVALDYYANNDDSQVQTKSWTGAELAACYTAGEKVVRLPFHVKQQLVRSFKVVLRWTFSGASSGPKPLMMRFRWAPKDSKGKRLVAAVKG